MSHLNGARRSRWSGVLALALAFSLLVATPASFAATREGRQPDVRIAAMADDAVRIPKGDVRTLDVSTAAAGETVTEMIARWLSKAGAQAFSLGASRDQSADDDFPAPLTLEQCSPVPYPFLIDSVGATDTMDVFRVYLAEGEQITLHLMCGTSLQASVLLWGPDATSVADEELRGDSAPVAGDVAYIDHTIPAGGTGWYHVGVTPDVGGDIYSLAWTVNSRSDGNIGVGEPLPDSGFTGYVDQMTDADDVYHVNLGVGQTIEVTITPTTGMDPSLYFFGPGATDVWGGGEIDYTYFRLTHTVLPGEAGAYYIDVYADGDLGAGYSVEWSVTENDIPGDSAHILPGSYTTDRVFYVDLLPGEVLNVDLSGVSGAVTPRLLGRGATSTATSPVLASGEGAIYTCPEGEGGRYYLWLDTTLPGTMYTVDVSTNATVTRVAAGSRYDTNVEMSSVDFPDGADVVVIARGDAFPDALSASALAGAYDAPILLTYPTALPDAVRDEIVRLGATRCFIVGGDAAVSPAVKAQIDAIPGMYTPVRVSGTSRYETATKVAERVFTRQGFRFYGVALVARGDSFPDALAFSPLAWGGSLPILLTTPTALPTSTAGFLARGEVFGVAIGGGNTAVSPAVATLVEGIVDDNSPFDIPDPVVRFAGDSRYETAELIARWADLSPFVSGEFLGLATGTNFPDALGGGAACGKSGGVLMLTQPTTLDPSGHALVSDWAGYTRSYQVFGGTSAVSDAVISQVDSYIITP